MPESFQMRNTSLTFLVAWILRISFIAFLIMIAFYLIVRLGGFNSVILRYALNTSNVGINPFDPTISLITFTAICSRFALNNSGYSTIIIL